MPSGWQVSLSPQAGPCLAWNGAGLCQCLLHLLLIEPIRESRAKGGGEQGRLLPSAVLSSPGQLTLLSLARASSPGASTASALALALTSLSSLLPELTSGEFTSKGACTTQQVKSGRFLSSPVHLLNKCLENID